MKRLDGNVGAFDRPLEQSPEILNAVGVNSAVNVVLGVTLAHGETPYFREFVLRLPGPAAEFLHVAEKRRILAGVPLERFDRERTKDLLVAATEKRTREEMDTYIEALTDWAKRGARATVKEAAWQS